MAFSPLAKKKYLAIWRKWSDLEIPPEARENLAKSHWEILGHVMPWVADHLTVKYGMLRYLHYGKGAEKIGGTLGEMLRGSFLLGLEYGLACIRVGYIINENSRFPAEERELLLVAKSSFVSQVFMIAEATVEAGKHSQAESKAFLDKLCDLMNRACFSAYVLGISTSVNLSK